MDLGVSMSADVLEDKLDCAHDGKNPETVWNTKRVPTHLEPGWNNRLFVACGGSWRGYFPLSGEVLWSPEDERAPCGLIFDTRGWTRIVPVPIQRFRGWRYVDGASFGVAAAPAPLEARPHLHGKNSSEDFLKKRAASAGSTSHARRKDHPTGK